MPIFTDRRGAQQEVTLSTNVFREAKDKNLTVRQLINQKFPTCEETDSFTQMCASEGLYFKADPSFGVNSPNLRQILDPPMSDKDAANTTRENPV